MKLDILIKNGHVVDPETGRDNVEDIGILGGKITTAKGEASRTIDASGCYVTPGLIDFHTHLFFGGNSMGIRPDFLLAFGITSAVDPGSAGCAAYELFHEDIVEKSKVRVKGLLNVHTSGMPGFGSMEIPDPQMMQKDKICKLVEKYTGTLLGLKIRIGADSVGENEAETLKAASGIAQDAGVFLCVHVTNSSLSAEEIISILKPGDIFCHAFQGRGNSKIIDPNGKLYPAVLKGREKGIIFDAANGMSHFSAEVARSAISQGFLPDVISSDAIFDSLCSSPLMRNFTFVMSKYLNLGLSMTDLIKRVTEIPAKLMGMSGKTGTLREGALADLCILKEKDKETNFPDPLGGAVTGSRLLVPQLTVLDGQIVYAQTDFHFS